MDIVIQHSPLLEEEDALAEQEVSLSAHCVDVLRSLPAAAVVVLDRKSLRDAAMHGTLRPHLFGRLSDEQLLELVKFVDFWELPLPWLQMVQAERGARIRPPTLLPTGTGARPLDAYSSESATWALWKEVEPVLRLLATRRLGKGNDAEAVWSTLRVLPTAEATTDERALHVLCGARQPELLINSRRHDTVSMSRVLASEGDLEALQWFHANGCPWDEWTCSYAALGGHLEVLQWVREHGCPWDEWTETPPASAAHTPPPSCLRTSSCRAIERRVPCRFGVRNVGATVGPRTPKVQGPGAASPPATGNVFLAGREQD